MSKMCPICYETFKMGDEIARLSCGHEFCSDCIYKWWDDFACDDDDTNKCVYCTQEVKDVKCYIKNAFLHGLFAEEYHDPYGDVLLKVVLHLYAGFTVYNAYQLYLSLY